MIKEKLQRAKAMIEAGDYAGARRLLRTIDHPTAQTWMQKLDQLETRSSTRPGTRAPQQTSFAGKFLNVLLALGVLGGVMFLIVTNRERIAELLPQTGAQPTAVVQTQITPEPTIDPLFTAVPDSFPCEPQRWWNENADYIYGYFRYERFFSEQYPESDYYRMVDDMADRRTRLAAAPYPACLEALRTEILVAMDAWSAAVNAPLFKIIELEELNEYEAADVLAIGTNTADSIESVIRVMSMLDQENIVYDRGELDSSTYIAKYAATGGSSCKGSRWIITDFLSAMSVLARAGLLLEEEYPSHSEVIGVIGDIQREQQRLKAVKPLSCLAVQHQLLIDMLQSLLSTLRSYYSDGINYGTALNANIFLGDIYALERTVQQIDTLGVLSAVMTDF